MKILCRFQVRKVRSQASIWTTDTYVWTPISLYYSSLHPFERLSNTSGHSSEFEKNPAFNCIRLDNVAILSGRQLVFDK
jgi:hypothetical protein